jgi:hypothetical protein
MLSAPPAEPQSLPHAPGSEPPTCGTQVGQPVPASGRAGDEEAAVDVEHPDLDAAWVSTVSSPSSTAIVFDALWGSTAMITSVPCLLAI